MSLPLSRRALAAIAFTDAVRFSARMAADEEQALALIDQDLQLIRAVCDRAGGQVLKSLGDGLMLYFESAIQAVICAQAIQRTLVKRQRRLKDIQPLQHRIGIHLGDVLFKDGDVMGNGVNIAARLQAEAKPGGICISQTVYDVVKSSLKLNIDDQSVRYLKNIQEAVPIYQIAPVSKPPSEHQSAQRQTANPAIQASPPTGRFEEPRSPLQRNFDRPFYPGLTYLAAQIVRESQALFRLKRNQPGWFQGQARRRYYTFSLSVFCGAMLGLAGDISVSIPVISQTSLVRALYGVGHITITLGLMLGLCVGLFCPARWLQPYQLLVRLMLDTSGYIPWNYLQDLDQQTQLRLLCKIGSGYLLMHQMLQQQELSLRYPFVI
ncbi:MAG: adenylate/guanylate cyclase domain-containing protein [Cyanobacteria bacterium P01_H01_bin.121]